MYKLIFILLVFTTLLHVSPAQAGFDITRLTTIIDDYSGSYTVSKSGRRDDGNFTGTSIAEFANFHPFIKATGISISGTISKTVIKQSGNRNTSSDAQLIVVRPEESLAISFTNLGIIIDSEGAKFEGEVSVNNEIFEVDDLPIKVRKLLKRVFYLTKK